MATTGRPTSYAEINELYAQATLLESMLAHTRDHEDEQSWDETALSFAEMEALVQELGHKIAQEKYKYYFLAGMDISNPPSQLSIILPYVD